MEWAQKKRAFVWPAVIEFRRVCLTLVCNGWSKNTTRTFSLGGCLITKIKLFRMNLKLDTISNTNTDTTTMDTFVVLTNYRSSVSFSLLLLIFIYNANHFHWAFYKIRRQLAKFNIPIDEFPVQKLSTSCWHTKNIHLKRQLKV